MVSFLQETDAQEHVQSLELNTMDELPQVVCIIYDEAGLYILQIWMDSFKDLFIHRAYEELWRKLIMK